MLSSKALQHRYDPQSGHNPSVSHFNLAKAGRSKLKEGPKSNSYFLANPLQCATLPELRPATPDARVLAYTEAKLLRDNSLDHLQSGTIQSHFCCYCIMEQAHSESAAHQYCKMSLEMLLSIHGGAGFLQTPVHEQLFAQISSKRMLRQNSPGTANGSVQ